MDELTPVYATCATVGLYFLTQWATGKFDPFAPVWLFLVGFVQVYVIQALSYHEWAVGVRGKDLVAAANFRAFWAFCGSWPSIISVRGGWPRRSCRGLPGAGRSSSSPCSARSSLFWGLVCAGNRDQQRSKLGPRRSHPRNRSSSRSRSS